MDMLVVVLKSEYARVKLGINHPVMPPHADQQCANENDGQPANNHSKVKSVFQHGSPHGLHQPCQNAAVSSDQQEGAEGYAVKHLRLRVVWQGLLPLPGEQPLCAVDSDRQKATV